MPPGKYFIYEKIECQFFSDHVGHLNIRKKWEFVSMDNVEVSFIFKVANVLIATN